MLKQILDAIEDKIAASEMTKDEYLAYSAKKEFPSFVSSMEAFREAGIPFEESIERFRASVIEVSSEDDEMDEEMRDDLLRVFEMSAERYRTLVVKARRLVTWAKPEDGDPHPQYPTENARHPETGDRLDETGAVL